MKTMRLCPERTLPGEGGESDPVRTEIPEGIDEVSGVFNCSSRDSLIALYNATDGPNWTNNTSWLSAEPLGDWHGIGVNAEGHVDSLILEDNGLSGPPPAALGDLAALRVLDVSDNQLTGTKPLSLFTLPNLVKLDLTGNQFSEIPVPSDWDALVAFLNATGGPNWTNNNWLTDPDRTDTPGEYLPIGL